MLQHLVNILFRPPPLPPIELPWLANLTSIRATIAKAIELAYYRGVYDGLIAGVLLTLLFVPSLRGRLTKGFSHAVDAIDG